MANTSLVITPPESSTPAKMPTKKTDTVYRIHTVFDKTIELDELSIVGDENAKKQKTEDVASIQFPLIKINNYVFNRSEIRSVKIDYTGFLPTITLNVGLVNKLFLSKEMPKDGDIISIAIRGQTDTLKIIRNDYVITGVHSMPQFTSAETPVFLTFYGELFVPGLRSQKFDFSFEGTSYYALQDFAKKYGLGFASNEQDTNDKQIWLKAGMTGDLYVRQITSRAWSDDNSFYDSWIDLYYNLNFVNINKQLISAESEIDLAAAVTNIDKNFTFGADAEQEKTSTTVKVFSNFKNYKTSSFYISTWRPLNRSSAITFEIGTKMACELFEHNRYLYEDSSKPKFWAVPIEPTYDKEKTNKMILLRGRASYRDDIDNTGKNKNTDLRRANYPFVDIYERTPWLGIQYTISNSDENNLQWDGNHHKNYQVARVKNLINNKELDKLNVTIQVTGQNFNIIRGDKIPVALIQTDQVETYRINPESNMHEALDLFYSGWYIVKGFNLEWDSGVESDAEGSISSNFTHEFILTRREWPAPIDIDPINV